MRLQICFDPVVKFSSKRRQSRRQVRTLPFTFRLFDNGIVQQAPLDDTTYSKAEQIRKRLKLPRLGMDTVMSLI